MYSTKKNIQELVSLLIAHNIKSVVLSPGSRNSPIIETLYNSPEFKCYSVVDERSAAFFALGLIQKSNSPVAVCCTSGTALMNIGSAVAEAFYQKLPLIVISADRPLAWIGQADGQTIPQTDIFKRLVKKSESLPEINSKEDEWFCNRLVNEALNSAVRVSTGVGPVHINIPISEPLFDFSALEIKSCRKICETTFKVEDIAFTPNLVKVLESSKRILIVVGQSKVDSEFKAILKRLSIEKNITILSENISNISDEFSISNFDELLIGGTEILEEFAPDLLITCRGEIISKRLKSLLKSVEIEEHWHIAADVNFPDTFKSLTNGIALDDTLFFKSLLRLNLEFDNLYSEKWRDRSKQISNFKNRYFSDIRPLTSLTAIRSLFERLPDGAAIHIGNGTTIRYTQLCNQNLTHTFYANRGTNGIDGSLSTAIGFAAQNSGYTYLFIGDMSFFYDINALLIKGISSKLRVIVLNNGGGEIFYQFPKLRSSKALDGFIACGDSESRHSLGELNIAGIKCYSANSDNFSEVSNLFLNDFSNQPIILEVMTDGREGANEYNEFLKNIKI